MQTPSKISDLIYALQQVKDEYGDIDVLDANGFNLFLNAEPLYVAREQVNLPFTVYLPCENSTYC